MMTRLGNTSAAYSFVETEDPGDAIALIQWVLDKRTRIQVVSQALWKGLWHILDFSYPDMGVDTALNEMMQIFTNWLMNPQADSTELRNAQDTALDIADLIISFDSDEE